MTTLFKTLRKEMPPERRKRNQWRTKLTLLALSFDEICREKGLGGKMKIVVDLTKEEETLVGVAAGAAGVDPTTYLANLIHRHLTQYKASISKTRPANGHAQVRRRVGNLHPGNFRPSDDFDAPLPDEFWFGEA